MYLFLIAISFLGSIAFALFLRRLDRPDFKTNQLRRLAEIQERNLESLAGEREQSIRDAILDYDLLVRQSRQVQEDLKAGYESYRSSLGAIQQEREVIDAISAELNRIAASARSVGEQVEKLDRGLERLALAEREIGGIHEELERLGQTLELKGAEADDTLNRSVERLIVETEERVRQLADNARASFQLLQTDYRQLNSRFEDQSRETDILSERLSNVSNRLEEKWLGEATRIEERAGDLERRLTDRIGALEQGLSGIRTAAVDSMQGEISRMRHELEDFNLAAITRRDEILNETRRMAEGIQDQVKLFQEKYLSAENRLIKDAQQYNAEMRKKYEEFEREWTDEQNARLAKLRSELADLESELEDLRRKELDDLSGEGGRLREEMRQSAQEQAARLERDIVQSQERLRELWREEERKQASHREEVAELQENISLIGQELKAALRAETDHSIGMLKDARRIEEEQLGRGRAELERARAELNEISATVEAELDEFARSRKSIEDFIGHSERALADRESEALKEMERRAARFLDEQESRLSRLSETIDEKISRQLLLLADRGQLQIEELEKRTQKEISETARTMEREMDEVRRLRDDFMTEVDQHRIRLERFEDRLQIVDRAEELIARFDDTLETLTERLNVAREENSKLDEYARNFEALRANRKELESELRLLENQRERMTEIEQIFFNVEKQAELLNEKFNSIDEAEELARKIEKRIVQFNEFKESFETYFGELGERRKFVENALLHIEKSRTQARQASELAETLVQQVERADLRQTDMRQGLQELETRANSLVRMEGQIQKVEARFEQMDGLLLDLDEKQKQISVMGKKVEEIRLSGEDVREELASLLGEADEKMDRLSAFYQTVEAMLDEASRLGESAEEPGRKGRRAAGGTVPEYKRNGILSLYLNHKWEPDLIAERMKIDPSVVRAVIASHSK